MKASFRVGDRLHIKPVLIEKLKKGDVIIFQGTDFNGEEKELVHRVVSIYKDGLYTRGDNNTQNDDILVTQKNFKGIVTHFERNGKKKPVKNGFQGMIKAKIRYSNLSIKMLIRVIFRMPYRALKKSRLVPKIWKPDIKKIYIKTLDGEIIKYIHGSHTVAQMWPKKKKFLCKKPYDLIIKPDNKIG
jgi:signal peptidase I